MPRRKSGIFLSHTVEAWQPDTGALLRLQVKDSNQVSQSTHNGIRLAIAGLFGCWFWGVLMEARIDLAEVFAEDVESCGFGMKQDTKLLDNLVRFRGREFVN